MGPFERKGHGALAQLASALHSHCRGHRFESGMLHHRLSTIRHCDRILVLDGGRIIEDGNYDELIEKGGFFAELVERQRLDTAG